MRSNGILVDSVQRNGHKGTYDANQLKVPRGYPRVLCTIATKLQHRITKRKSCGRFSGRLQEEINVKVPFPGPRLYDSL